MTSDECGATSSECCYCAIRYSLLATLKILVLSDLVGKDCHSHEGGNPTLFEWWIPVYAGMTAL